MPAATTNRPLAAAPRAVLPARLTAEEANVLQKTLKMKTIEQGYAWILQKMSDKKNPIRLADCYVERYVDEVRHRKNAVLGENTAIYRSAMLASLWLNLPRCRLKFADKGFNYVFLDTWLKKKLLAQILGVELREVEKEIFLSGQRPLDFLNDRLHLLVSFTFLKRMLANRV